MLNVICLRNAYRLIIGRVISALLLFLAFASSGYGQISFEKEPINYLTATSNDRVAKLIKAIEDGHPLPEKPFAGSLRVWQRLLSFWPLSRQR